MGVCSAAFAVLIVEGRGCSIVCTLHLHMHSTCLLVGLDCITVRLYV